jgi:putative transposase
MTDKIALCELLKKGSEVGFLRKMIGVVLQHLM